MDYPLKPQDVLPDFAFRSAGHDSQLREVGAAFSRLQDQVVQLAQLSEEQIEENCRLVAENAQMRVQLSKQVALSQLLLAEDRAQAERGTCVQKEEQIHGNSIRAQVLRDQKQKTEQVEAQMASVAAENAQLRSEQTNLTQQVAELRDIARLLEEERAFMKGKLAAMPAERAAFVKQIADLQLELQSQPGRASELETLRAQCEKLAAELQEAKVQVQLLSKQKENAELHALRSVERLEQPLRTCLTLVRASDTEE